MEEVKAQADNSGKLIENRMWTEKYKPMQASDLVGNAGAIAQLYEWLKDWDEVVLRGNKK